MTLSRESTERPVGGVSTNPVGRQQTDVVLEVLDGVSRRGAENAVNPRGVEPELPETTLEFGYVVAAQHRGAQIEMTVTEVPICFNEGCPGGRITNARGRETPGMLEGRYGCLCSNAVDPGVGTGWLETSGAQTSLQVSDSLAGGTRY